VGGNEMSLLTGGEQASIFRGDDLKVLPTECIGLIKQSNTLLQPFKHECFIFRVIS